MDERNTNVDNLQDDEYELEVLSVLGTLSNVNFNTELQAGEDTSESFSPRM